MSNLHLYDKLLQFALFQGMSQNDLENVVTRIKLGFHTVEKNKKIAKEGMICNQIIFLISGKLSVDTYADDKSYHVVEDVLAPTILQQECLWGLSQRYTSTYTTMTECNLITIDKEEIRKLVSDFDVFRINILNILATQVQKLKRYPWKKTHDTLQERIIQFLEWHTVYPAGHKTIHILMRQLAHEVNDSRLDVSVALNHMQQQGLIILKRGSIDIPYFEKLLMK